MKQIPRFYGFRIYFISALLYFFLVLPIAGILLAKFAPDWIQVNDTSSDITSLKSESIQEKGKSDVDSSSFVNLNNDSLNSKRITFYANKNNDNFSDSSKISNINKNKTSENISNNSTRKGRFEDTLNLLIKTLFLSFLLGLLFNLPFKNYFRKKRKNLKIPDRLFSFCRKMILKSPIINLSIFIFPFAVNLIFMIYVLVYKDFSDEMTYGFYAHFFFISLVSTLLVAMFFFFWEKHRVHIKYIDHIFSEKELRKRIFSQRVGKIKNRLWISNAMTTLFPLTIVIFYLFLSITTIKDLGLSQMSSEQLKILFGKYITYFNNVDIQDYESFVYVNAFDTILMFIGIFTGIAISIIYILFFVNWTTNYIVGPVKELLFNMQKTGRGEMDQFGIVRTNDEIGELTEGYNDMSLKIRNYINKISNINEANSRFVPQQLLEFLGKDSIEDISVGDQVQKEMTVLFSDIRSFTSISEEMTPKENFDFLNAYLGYMEPVIRKNNGFIDKYIGDSIMALFSENAENAVEAAIEIRKKLSFFNKKILKPGIPKIENGIGIHQGNLMLGIIGGEGRYDGTVISDAVNLSSRLEGLTKLYGASIIISEDALIGIKNPEKYNYRFLDIVKVKGKKSAVYVFEILDGDDTKNNILKIETKAIFSNAIQLYKNKKFMKAMDLFKEVYEQNNEDQAAALYIKRCEYYFENEISDSWDGVEVIDDKF